MATPPGGASVCRQACRDVDGVPHPLVERGPEDVPHVDADPEPEWRGADLRGAVRQVGLDLDGGLHRLRRTLEEGQKGVAPRGLEYPVLRRHDLLERPTDGVDAGHRSHFVHAHRRRVVLDVGEQDGLQTPGELTRVVRHRVCGSQTFLVIDADHRNSQRSGVNLGSMDHDSRRGLDSRPGRPRDLAQTSPSLALRPTGGLLWCRMPGITRLATYFPRRRLDRALIAKAWGTRAGGRQPDRRRRRRGRAHAWPIDAALACLGERRRRRPSTRCYFASTSAPYGEKQVASVVATAADLPRDDRRRRLRAAPARAGLARAARPPATRVRGGQPGAPAGGGRRRAPRRARGPSSRRCSATARRARARSGASDVIAELVGAASVAEEFTYLWRTDEQRYLQVADARFGNQLRLRARRARGREPRRSRQGRAAARPRSPRSASPRPTRAPRPTRRSASAAIRRRSSTPSLPSRPACSERRSRWCCSRARSRRATPGRLHRGRGVRRGRRRAGLPRHRRARRRAGPCRSPSGSRAGMPVPSYERYLRARGVLPADVGGELVPTYIEWKELKQDVRLYGSRCEACGLVQYPQARVCLGCRARERMEDAQARAARRRCSPSPSTTWRRCPSIRMPMVVVDLDGGGRVYLQGDRLRRGRHRGRHARARSRSAACTRRAATATTSGRCRPA